MSLNKENIAKIHDASLQILRNTGIIFDDERAINCFAKAGVKIDGKKVFLTENVVEESLQSCPREIEIIAKDPIKDIHLGNGHKYCMNFTGAVYVDDAIEGRRKSTSLDYINFTKLAQSSSMFEIVGGPMVDLSDLPEQLHPAFMMLCLLTLTDKPLFGFGLNGCYAKKTLEMAKCYFQEEEKNYLLAMPNVTCPLYFDEDALGVIFEFLEAEQPIIISTAGLTGMTSPVTLAGTLAITNAEVLAGVVLTQLMKPGSPVLYGNISLCGDMKHMRAAVGSAETAILTNYASQMAKFYQLPCRAGGIFSDAVSLDVQAGYESMMGAMMAFSYNSDIIVHSAGLLDCLITASYEKFIVDEEIYHLVKRINRGMEINDKTLALDEINKIGPGGNFLESMHTFENFRNEVYMPLVSNRNSYENRLNDKKTVVMEANQIYRKRISDYHIPETISKERIRPVLAYWKKYCGDFPLSFKDVINSFDY